MNPGYTAFALIKLKRLTVMLRICRIESNLVVSTYNGILLLAAFDSINTEMHIELGKSSVDIIYSDTFAALYSICCGCGNFKIVHNDNDNST